MGTKGNIHYPHTSKVFSIDAMIKVVSNTVELMGSYGYAEEYGVQKIIQLSIGSNETMPGTTYRPLPLPYMIQFVRWEKKALNPLAACNKTHIFIYQ